MKINNWWLTGDDGIEPSGFLGAANDPIRETRDVYAQVDALRPVEDAAVLPASSDAVTLNRGGKQKVYSTFKAKVALTAPKSGGKVTFTAPAGTTFAAGQDAQRGQHKSANGTWSSFGDNELLNGQRSADGTTYTFDLATRNWALAANQEFRFGFDVETPADVPAGEGTMQGRITGSTNEGSFDATTSTKAVIPAEGGGLNAIDGPDATLERGKEQTVYAQGTYTEAVSSLDATVTLTAPKGTTFVDGKTIVNGQQQAPGSSDWISTANAKLTDGVRSADGTTYTYTWKYADQPKREPGAKFRFPVQVAATDNTPFGDDKLAYTIKGKSNLGATDSSASTKTTVPGIEGGGLAAVDGPDVKLERGSTTKVFPQLKYTATTDKARGEIVFTAPAGTTFAPDQTEIWSDYKLAGATTWTHYSQYGKLSNGRYSADNRTLTFSYGQNSDDKVPMVDGLEVRWPLQITTPKNASAGIDKVGYTLTGSTAIGSFDTKASIGTTVADLDGGGLTASNGPDVELERGKAKTVYAQGTYTESITSLDTTVTLTAPDGTTFVDGRTDVDGQQQTPTGTDWVRTDFLKLADGVRSADGKSYTYKWKHPGASPRDVGGKFRFPVQVTANQNAPFGDSSLGYTIAGKTNLGATDTASSTKTTIPEVDGGGLITENGPDVELERGKAKTVYAHGSYTEAVNGVDATVTLTAPSGSTFVDAGPTKQGQQQAVGSDAWANTAYARLTNGERSADGKTYTYTWLYFDAPEREAGAKFRFPVQVTANQNAAFGGGKLDYTITGKSNLGTTDTASSTKTTIPEVDGGGLAAVDGPKKTLTRGGTTKVFPQLNYTATTDKARGKIVFTAPAGTTFAPDQTVVRSDYKLAGATTWTQGSQYGQLQDGRYSNDNRTLTFGYAQDSDNRVPMVDGLEMRWPLEVTTPKNASAGAGTVGYTLTGSTAIGSFDSKASIETTIPAITGGGVTAQNGPDTTLERGKETTVYAQGVYTEAASGVDATVTLTAPKGTTFPEGKATVFGDQQAPGANTWIETAYARLTDGVRSADGTTYTYKWKHPRTVTREQGAKFRFRVQVITPADASAGTGSLGYTIAGASNLGSFDSNGSTKTTVEAPAHTELTAKGRFDAADPTKRAQVHGAAEAGATVILRDAKGAEIGRTTAKADDTYVIDVDPTKVTIGENHFTVIQQIGGKDSAPVSVSLDYGQQAPVAISTPADGSKVDSGRPTFSGTGQPGSTIVVKGTSRAVATATVGADGTWTAQSTIALGDGVYALTAVQTAKGALTTSANVRFTIDTTPARTELTAKAAFDAKQETAPATVSGDAESGARVVLRDRNGNEIGATTAVNGKYSITIDPKHATYGENNFTVVQVIGGKPSAPVPTSLDYGSAPAAIVITSPANGSTVAKDGLTFQGTGQPGAEIAVRGTTRAIATGTVGTDGAWSAAVTVALTDNVYALTGVQTTKGGLTTKTPITVTIVDKVVADVTAKAAFDALDETKPATVSGTGQPGATVQVKNGTTVIGSVTVGLGGKYSITVDPAKAHENVNTFTAVQVADGKTSQATTTLDYGTAAAPVITTPKNGDTLDNGVVRFEGTGEPGAKVTVRGTSSAVTNATSVSLGGTWGMETNRTLTPNVYRLFAVQTAKGGLTKQAEVTITVTDKKTVELTAQGTFDKDATKNATISGAAETGATVIVREGAATVATTTAVAGRYSVEIKAAGTGVRSFAATQIIGGKESKAVPVDLDYGTPAAATVASPSNGDELPAGRITFTGTGEPGATVKVSGTTSALGSGVVNEEGVWTILTDRSLTPSTYTLFVKQTTKGNVVGEATTVNISVR